MEHKIKLEGGPKRGGWCKGGSRNVEGRGIPLNGDGKVSTLPSLVVACFLDCLVSWFSRFFVSPFLRFFISTFRGCKVSQVQKIHVMFVDRY